MQTTYSLVDGDYRPIVATQQGHVGTARAIIRGMTETTAEIHIYASGRTFVVVPITRAQDGAAIETTPARTVPLTLGQPTSYRISRVIREARADCGCEGMDQPLSWDGDGGRWWQHHLMAVAVRWSGTQVRILDLDQTEGRPLELPAQVSNGELADHLIQVFGQKLSAR